MEKGLTAMDLDDVLPHVGAWEKYQHLLLLLVCLPACIPCGISAFNQVFMDRTPDHWCRVPELIEANLTVEQRKILSIPQVNSHYDKCSMYDIDYRALLAANEGNTHYAPDPQTRAIPCVNGWEFDLTEIPSSIVIDFELVCSKSLLPTLGLSALNVGGLIGVLLFGYLNDRIGRKKNFFLCLTVQIAFGTASAFAPNFIVWSIFRFFVGLTVPAILHIPFVICLEVVAPAKRTLVSFCSNMFYVMGLVAFSGISYGVREWKWLALVTSLPFTIYYIYIFFLPESMRWLLAQGRIDEVITMLKQVAVVNKKEVAEETFKRFKETVEHHQQQSKKLRSGKKANYLDLFRTPNMRVKTFIISFSWTVNEAVYIGLSYYGPAIGSDAHLSFFLSCIVEIPGYILCLLLMDRIGRRMTLCFCMIISGIASISTALIPPESATEILILFLIAKCTIAGGTMTIFQYAGELYPTEVRGIGIGLASFLGCTGLTGIPFINYLGAQWLVLPIVIMGIFTIIGGITSLSLPETLHAKLPQSVEEGELFGKDFSGWQDIMDRMHRFVPRKSKLFSLDRSDANLSASIQESISYDQQQKIDKIRY